MVFNLSKGGKPNEAIRINPACDIDVEACPPPPTGIYIFGPASDPPPVRASASRGKPSAASRGRPSAASRGRHPVAALLRSPLGRYVRYTSIKIYRKSYCHFLIWAGLLYLFLCGYHSQSERVPTTVSLPLACDPTHLYQKDAILPAGSTLSIFTLYSFQEPILVNKTTADSDVPEAWYEQKVTYRAIIDEQKLEWIGDKVTATVFRRPIERVRVFTYQCKEAEE